LGEDKNFLSQESIQKLSNTISEAKNLAGLQLEILEKVIAVEEKIASTRIGYLDEYFDAYSRGLDGVARKQSQLEEGYIILNNEAEKLAAYTSSSDNGRVEEIENETAAIKDRYEIEEQLVNDDARAKMAAEEAVADAKIKQANRVAEAYIKHAQNNPEEQDNEVEKTSGGYDVIEAARAAQREKNQKRAAEQEENLAKKITALHVAQHQTEAEQAAAIKDIRMANADEVADAELSYQNLINEVKARQAYTSAENYVDSEGKDTGVNEAGAMRAKQMAALQNDAFVRKLEEGRTAYIKRRELELARKNGKALSAEQMTRIQKEADLEYNKALENQEKIAARERELDYLREKDNERRKAQNDIKTLAPGSGASSYERKQAWTNLNTDEYGNEYTGLAKVIKVIDTSTKLLSTMAKELEKQMDEIARAKGKIDTRLQGSNNEQYKGSYWDQLVKDMTRVSATTPFFKQEDFAKNIETLVAKGISFDLKQRAFLMTVSDKIASTFEVSNATLLRLVRIQQEDSTAGRLGMESALNSFLNEMYETSEYLEGVAGSVRDSLKEMESLMAGAEAAEVEYQVQKWLGSLYSVGMSDEAVGAISSALGQIGAGQVEGLSNGGAGNLLIMAANDAGLSIADILTDGLDSSDTNKLLEAAVGYLAELSDSAADNRVVQQQLANVFGVKASDLRAATNLVGSSKSVYKNSLSYEGMMEQLYAMAGSMGDRTSMGEMMSNVWENFRYSLSGSMASNPGAYTVYKIATLLDNVVGGIPIPDISIYGNMVGLNTTVADLMRVGASAVGILSGAGNIISGLSSSFSGASMLEKLGIGTSSGLTVVHRGEGESLLGSKSAGGGTKTTSGSGSAYVGNASGSDIKDSTMQEAKDSKEQQMIEAQEEAGATAIDVINTTVLKIYEVLDSVASGKSSFSVKVEGYGLTKAGAASAAAGVSALANSLGSNSGLNSLSGGLSSGGSSSSAGSGGTSGGALSSVGVSSGGIDFGSWVAV
jgi:hypothetical protein